MFGLKICKPILLIVTATIGAGAFAEEPDPKRLIEQMSAEIAALDSFIVHGDGYSDARLAAGQLIEHASHNRPNPTFSPANLADPDTRMPMATVLKLWRAIMKWEEGTAIGVRIGSTCRARSLGLVGYAMYYSRDLLEAFQRI